MHTKYPENSLAAFQHSIDSGVDIIETDIRTTKDGKLILMHDGSVDRTTNGEGKVKDFTFAELEKLKLESDDSQTYRVPLAEDALNLAHGKIMVDLDMKDVYVKHLVNLVHKTQTKKQVLFFDSDFAVLDGLQRHPTGGRAAQGDLRRRKLAAPPEEPRAGFEEVARFPQEI